MSKNKLVVVILTLFFFTGDLHPQIRIKAVGDIMLGSITPKKILPPQNGKIFLKPVKTLLDSAEILFGNLEGTFIDENFIPEKCSEKSRRAKSCYEFGMPKNLVPVLKSLNFTVLNLDNNHSEDYGFKGYEFTQKILDSLNIIALPKRKFGSIKIKDKNIVIVPFGFSSNSNHISDSAATVNIISNLKQKYDWLIVSFHGGAEGSSATHINGNDEIFYGEDRGNVEKFAHLAVDAGADLIIGHGPHVLRAMEIYKNRLIMYSLGNFITYGNVNIDGINGVSVIADIYLNEQNGQFLSGNLIPVKQIGNGIAVFDKDSQAVDLIKKLSCEDFPTSNPFITNDGKIYQYPDRELKYKRFDFPEKKVKYNMQFIQTEKPKIELE